MTLWIFYLFLFCAAIFVLFILSYAARLGQKRKNNVQKKKRIQAEKEATLKGLLINCPLCNAYLLKGENLVSQVYRPMNVPDQLCIIKGCAHCYPKVEEGLKRQCPVCGKNVSIEEHLVARLFNYKDGKKHVRVMGCQKCCRNSPQ